MTNAARAASVADARDALEHDVIGGDDGLVEVAEQGEGDLFLGRPRFLREGAVNADAVDLGAQLFVRRDATGDVAHFRRADTGEPRKERRGARRFPCRSCR